MRIAISGSHATGKSTLVRELATRHPTFTVIDEPYYLLMDAGHVFGDPPIAEDFELMLERSMSDLNTHQSGDVFFDRSPADYLAYLAAFTGDALDKNLVTNAGAALATLDLVVFVPVEQPDRIAGAEEPRLRRKVNRLLREMLSDDGWGFGVPVIEVSGTLRQRAETIEAALGRLG